MTLEDVSFTKSAINISTTSCLALYLLRSSATLQWFKTCESVCRSLQSLHWSERPSLLLQIAKLALWGSVSWAAFRANFRHAGGKCCTVSDHRVAASSSTRWCSSPWVARLLAWCSLSSTSDVFTVLFVLSARPFLLAPGSATIAARATSMGLKWSLCCGVFSSF